MVIVKNEPIKAEEIPGKVPFPDGTGSVVLHFAVVKPEVDGRPTAGVRLEAAGDVEAEMRMLESDLRHVWQITDIMLIRRLGDLKIGEVISVAVVAAEGREAAFGACHDAVGRFKSMKSIGKREIPA